MMTLVIICIYAMIQTMIVDIMKAIVCMLLMKQAFGGFLNE